MNIQKLAIVTIIALVLVGSVYFGHSTEAKSKADKKVEKAIDKAIGKATEGHYAKIDIVNISKFNDNSTQTVYNKTGGTVTPPSPPPNPPPNPPPVNVSGFKLCMVGDLSGNSVPNAMKNCNYKIGLGDLGYKSDLSWFKSLGFDKCVIGNHDAKEDGSASIEKEALAYCGNSWWLKYGNKTLLLGFNTNGDIAPQLDAAKKLLFDDQFMSGVKNVIALSHKNGHVFPSAHHPAEASSLYSKIEDMGLANVKIYEVSGHNHDLAAASNGLWFISGAGGKSHYACSTSNEWPYCDNSHYGFLQFTIDNNGNITPNFIDTSGKIIH